MKKKKEISQQSLKIISQQHDNKLMDGAIRVSGMKVLCFNPFICFVTLYTTSPHY